MWPLVTEFGVVIFGGLGAAVVYFFEPVIAAIGAVIAERREERR